MIPSFCKRPHVPVSLPPTSESAIHGLLEANGGLARLKRMLRSRTTESLGEPGYPVPIHFLVRKRPPRPSRPTSGLSSQDPQPPRQHVSRVAGESLRLFDGVDSLIPSSPSRCDLGHCPSTRLARSLCVQTHRGQERRSMTRKPSWNPGKILVEPTSQ